MTDTISGGELVVRALAAHDVELVFGIPGTHNLEIYRGLNLHGIRHVNPRHEQGAGYAADGYARSTGKPGVVITTSGPALTNAATAAATSYADSVPVLYISPGVPVGKERADIGLLHEAKDQRGAMDDLVSRSIRVTSIAEIEPAIAAIFAGFATDRPRPVHLEIPLDLLDGAFEHPFAAVEPYRVRRHAADAESIREAATALRGAGQVAILAGGGATGATAEVTALAERLGAPVVTTTSGKGVVPEGHPLSLGASIRFAEAVEFLNRADVLVIVGSEVADSDLWGNVVEPSGTVVRIDLDPLQLHKNVHGTITLLGDAALTVRGLLDELGTGSAAGDAVDADLDGIRRSIDAAAMADGAKWRQVQDVVRYALGPDVIVAGDSAQVTYYGTVHFLAQDRPRRFLYPTGYATLGYGLPAAIGAKLAQPSAPVVALVGDGGFVFTMQELLTAAEAGLGLPIVVMNNGGYAQIKEQMVDAGIAPLAVDLFEPDFVLLAEACGARGIRVTLDEAGAAQLAAELTASLERDRPTLIEVVPA
jgi:acetolactate synthase-1/2/3 large subunit